MDAKTIIPDWFNRKIYDNGDVVENSNGDCKTSIYKVINNPYYPVFA